MQRGLLLHVVVLQGFTLFQLLASKDQALLVSGNPFLIGNFRLDIFDAIVGLDLQGDGLAGQRLDEDLHAAAQAQDQVQRGLLLHVVLT